MQRAASTSLVGFPVRLAALVGAIGGIGWLDYATGEHFGFSLFYLVPVVAAGLWLGVAAALVCAVFASTVWFAADVALVGPTVVWISIWNAFSRLVMFSFVGVLTALLRIERQRLQELLAESESIARTDAVTELPNLRAFLEVTASELARAQREDRSICVMCVDLDNFKKVNDRYGHAAGNALLGTIGAAIRDAVRAGDVPARIGGDEFAVLLWGADALTGLEVAERVVDRIVELRRDYPDTQLGASAGVAYFASPPEDPQALLRAADQAMYEAKSSGKSQAIVRAV